MWITGSLTECRLNNEWDSTVNFIPLPYMHGGNLFKTVLIICLEHSCTGNFKKILIDQVMEWLSAVFKHLFFFLFSICRYYISRASWNLWSGFKKTKKTLKYCEFCSYWNVKQVVMPSNELQVDRTSLICCKMNIGIVGYRWHSQLKWQLNSHLEFTLNIDLIFSWMKVFLR